MTAKAPTVTVDKDGRLRGNQFVAIRDRGLLNAMMTLPAENYRQSHPGMDVKWVYGPPNGENTMVVAHEAMGFKVVDYGELASTESSKTSGAVRCGDAILMCGPQELFDDIAEADAKAASDDLRLPETAFYENVEAQKTRRRDGEIDGTKPIGHVRRTSQAVQPKLNPEGGE